MSSEMGDNTKSGSKWLKAWPVLIAVITFVFSAGGSYTANAATNVHQDEIDKDHEMRIRYLEVQIASDLARIKEHMGIKN